MNIDLDLRYFRRYPDESDCTVSVADRSYTARIIDYSFNGLGILVYGFTALRTGTILRLDSEKLAIHGKCRVIWTRGKESSLRAGLLKNGPLSGSFEQYRLSDILIGLQRTLKTGIITVKKGNIIKKIYIKHGNTVFASSNQDSDRLGDILLRKRKISKAQYRHAADIKAKTAQRYAAILVDLGMLKPSELKSAVEIQTKRILGSLFTLRSAYFEFTEGSFPSKDIPPLKLSVSNLIFRELKKNADLKLLKEHLLDAVLDFAKTPLFLFQNIHLTKKDRAILAFIDGKTTIKELAQLAPDNGYDSLKSIYALLEARIIEISAERKSSSGISHKEVLGRVRNKPSALAKKIDALYGTYHHMDYYEVLGLKIPSSDDIKMAYYRAVKEFHPDRHVELPEEMKSKLIELYTYITNAYLTLIDPEQRREYDRCIHLDKSSLRTGNSGGAEYPVFEKDTASRFYHRCLNLNQSRVARNYEIAVSKYNEGKDKFRKKKYKEAAHFFAMAIYFDSTVAGFHYHYGCALSEIEKLRDAVKALNRALELKPHDTDIVTKLGDVYLKLGFPLRAKGYFEKALRRNAGHKKAQEGLKKLKNV